MSFDTAIAANGDLILSGGRDLQGVTANGLIEQTIRTRLKIQRGSWAHDGRGVLGSRLHEVVGMAPEKAATYAPLYAREALEGLDGAEITDIQAGQSGNDMVVVVYYTPTVSEGEIIMASEEPMEFNVTVPIK